MANYNVEKFRFWCHKILPLVYDDSLSYYEFLCKVIAKLNEVIDELGTWEEAHATTVQITQELTTDTTLVPSSNAVKEALDDLSEELEGDIGSQADAIEGLSDRMTTAEGDIDNAEGDIDDLQDAIESLTLRVAALEAAVADHLLLNDGEVTSARITAGDYTPNLNSVLYHNKAVLLGTDFMARADIANVPTQTPGTLVTRAVLQDSEISSATADKGSCIVQTFYCHVTAGVAVYVRTATWDINSDDYVWTDWLLAAVDT